MYVVAMALFAFICALVFRFRCIQIDQHFADVQDMHAEIDAGNSKQQELVRFHVPALVRGWGAVVRGWGAVVGLNLLAQKTIE